MARPNRKPCRSARAQNRRRPGSARRPRWFGRFQRAHRALSACLRLINASLRTVAACERGAALEPARTSRRLDGASGELVRASRYLYLAACHLAAANEWIGREPERSRFAPECLIYETRRWLEISAWLDEVAGDVFDLQEALIHGLLTGAFIPEPERGPRRRRIAVTPRPLYVRAFLAGRRQPRVGERITPLLLRRRRTPRPAEVRVPRRNLRGRAPPLSSICAL